MKEKESSEQVVEREREDFTKQEELKVSEDQLDSATSPTVTADAQQKHHLDMHEQQKQLFNTSNNENIENTDKTEVNKKIWIISQELFRFRIGIVARGHETESYYRWRNRNERDGTTKWNFTRSDSGWAEGWAEDEDQVL